MAKPEARIGALELVFLLGALLVAGRAGYLQLVEGKNYAKQATAERTVRRVLDAPRGAIFDRGGTLLAASLERYRIDISGEQVKARDSLLRVYRADVGFKVAKLRDALRAKDDFYAHGPFTAGQVRRLRGFRGVHLTPVYRREYPSGPLARPLIGALSPDSSRGASGLERFLDSLLSGVPGTAVFIKDGQGRIYESPGRVGKVPVKGHDVVLTIDGELQEIAEGALTEVFRQWSPRSGDIVFLDPRTGEVLAAASRQVTETGTQLASASYFNSSFEPGSTAKPLTAAALLALDRVKPQETVAPENGVWAVKGRPRPVRDDHPQKHPISLARTIQVSSNVGIGKFSLRLDPVEHYEMLRAFGLGTPTGVEFPGEDPGRLPRPDRWNPVIEGLSAAMGYAIMVTPVQLAAAYGAIANDGILMAPTLIKEVRAPDGSIIHQHEPLAIRRVISSEVAATLRQYLALSAADSGTGGQAQVKGTVLGKTGTARLVKNRRYTDEHAASFAGMYPARDPQLVFVVRIERPQGDYYGGLVAAPVVQSMLRQALSARRTSLDRVRLAEDRVPGAPKQADRPAGKTPPAPRSWVALPVAARTARPSQIREVPDVVGQPVRTAAASLHRRGFQVRLEGAGVVQRTVPAAGDSLGTGKAVTLVASRGRSS